MVPPNSLLETSASLVTSSVPVQFASVVTATVISNGLYEHGSCGSVGVSPLGGFNSSPFVTPSPSQSANK